MFIWVNFKTAISLDILQLTHTHTHTHLSCLSTAEKRLHETPSSMDMGEKSRGLSQTEYIQCQHPVLDPTQDNVNTRLYRYLCRVFQVSWHLVHRPEGSASTLSAIVGIDWEGCKLEVDGAALSKGIPWTRIHFSPASRWLGHASSRSSPQTCLLRVTLPGVQDSR